MIRALHDTNVLLSALLFGGIVFDELIDATIDGRVSLLSSPFILNELDRILREKFGIPMNTRNDNAILACAEAGCAHVIVTGDKKDLLVLKQYRKIPILAPRTFYDILVNQKKQSTLRLRF